MADSRAPVRVTRRRSQTRARLLDAGFAVFAARGFGQARIEEVCEAAGFTRGAFYSNFDSLEELFFALYQQRAQQVLDQVVAALATEEGRRRDVPELIDRVVDALSVDRDWLLVKTDFALHAARSPAVATVWAAHRDGLRAALAASLRSVVDASALPGSLRTPDGLARTLIAVHEGTLLELLIDPDHGSLRGRLTDVFTALLAPPGPLPPAA
jgi:AcrR family transcriptional regulator